MKLSLAWIFDHIDGTWSDYDSNLILARFNQITAEIEHSYAVEWNLKDFYLALLENPTGTGAFIPELQQEVSLSRRITAADFVVPGATNIPFLVKKIGSSFVWATLADFGVEKEGVMPALAVDEHDLKGGWRNKFEARDIILEVDNKSITHRPDMWGHRGFAREIAAMFKLNFKPKKDFLTELPVKRFDKKSQATEQTPFIIENNAPQACCAFNGLFFPTIHQSYSSLFMVSRLLKVDARPINGIVDATNYVMLDWGYPVHAYDATKVLDKNIVVRFAKEQEKLRLLDNNELSLTAQDLVIANGQKAMCLAGVKGGLYDSINPATHALFLECANFDPGFVRRSALRHKTRTDASARFEKTLDPQQAIETMFRFLSLLKEQGIVAIHANEIIAVGDHVHEEVIQVEHAFLEERSGLKLTLDEVVELLTRLEFRVEVVGKNYSITVPTFRSSKDIKAKEDILEEVIRLYGFEKVPHVLPPINRLPFDLEPLKRMRQIRQFLAYSAGMIEQLNDVLFDEQFLAQLDYRLQETITLLNPVSENARHLVTTLVPALLKNVQDNLVHHDSLRFFEIAKIWELHKQEAHEKQSLTGLFFEKRKAFDFYQGKDCIVKLLTLLGLSPETIEWRKIEKPHQPWYRPFQTAELWVHHKKIGIMGNIDPAFTHKFGALPESDAFIFELDAYFLMHEPAAVKKYQPVSRYQETFFDLSLMVPLSLTAHTIQSKFQHLSSLVTSVELLDFFEKEGWADVRSVTFRLWLSHQERTLEKEEIEQVRKQALSIVELVGARVRE